MRQIPNDPFTDNVIAALPRDVRRSLSEVQLTAIRDALSRVSARSRHIIDVRFSVPLFFSRYYTVFLFGKDRRSIIQRLLMQRRRESGRIAMVFLFAVVAAVLLLGLLTACLGGLYWFKSQLGIDIFPEQHLGDILRIRQAD